MAALFTLIIYKNRSFQFLDILNISLNLAIFKELKCKNTLNKLVNSQRPTVKKVSAKKSLCPFVPAKRKPKRNKFSALTCNIMGLSAVYNYNAPDKCNFLNK